MTYLYIVVFTKDEKHVHAIAIIATAKHDVA